MRILFMGTPDFAVEILTALGDAGLDICGVFSQPDKPKGRGHKMIMTDVKKAALERGYEVYQPETLRNGAIEGLLNELKPELIVVAAYGKILPEYVLNFPKYGCINVHASILPKYRGAAPIQWSIINGDKETGITIQKMAKGVDTGDIISIQTTPIGEYETSEELFNRLAKIGSELLIKTIADIENGTATYTPQNDADASHAPMIDKSMAEIDWTKTSAEISKLICGMNSWPLAWTYYNGEMLKIVTAEKCAGAGKSGEILGIEKGRGMIVATGDGAICVKTAQFANSRKMSVEDYARGHEVKIGTILGGR